VPPAERIAPFDQDDLVRVYAERTYGVPPLEDTQAGDGARLAMLVLHDDARREYAHGPARDLPATPVGTFPPALDDEATRQGWVVVSMQRDWRRIVAFDPEPREETTMNALRTPLLALAALAATLCTGCSAMLIATGASTAASILVDNRSMAQQASDLQTKAAIEQALTTNSATLAAEVDVDVFLGRVMLTGVVDSGRARWKATEIARGAAGGAEVFDDITIGDPGIDQTAANIAANKALGVNLLAQEGIASQSLLHRVVNGTAFVMGEVQTESQVRTVRETALNTTGVSYVVTHITLEQD